MTEPQTLISLSGGVANPGRLTKAVLVLIDAQEEYVTGRLALPGADAAVAAMGRLLTRARAQDVPIIHVVHHGQPGGLFDPDGAARIAPSLAPREDEPVAVKTAPNAFTSPAFREALAHIGRKRMIVGGFTTHICVSSATRAAIDHNIAVTVIAEACAARELPSPFGGVMSATHVHEAALTILADRFATVLRRPEDLPD